MTRILGTARLDRRDRSVYFCARCGIERPARYPVHPDRLCRDCLDVLRNDKETT